MSLLLNLINYSSSQNQYGLSFVNQDNKDQRSRSLFHNSQQSKTLNSKLSSKSLSKLLNQNKQQKIDPKTRILHRINHLINIKCKKHYYTLFVTLQTIKKKNLYLTPQGQFDKYQNKIQHFSNQNNQSLINGSNEAIKQQKHVKSQQKQQKQVIQKQIKQNSIKQLQVGKSNKQKQKKLINKQVINKKLEQFMERLEQIQNLIIIKNYQQYTKNQFFSLIKNYQHKQKQIKLHNKTINQDKIKNLVCKVQKCRQKVYEYRFIRKLKRINQYAFKIQILFTLLLNINKKYSKINPFQQFNSKSQSFDKIKQFQSKLKKQQNKIITQKSQIKTKQLVSKVQQQIILSITQQQKSNKQAQLFKQLNQIPNPIIINQIIPNNQSQLSNLIKQPLQSLQTKITNLEKRKFQRNNQTILKSYQTKINLNQQPMFKSLHIKQDKSSNFCKKIPKNYFSANSNDPTTQFNSIFTDYPQKNNLFTNKFKQSRVIPYLSNKFNRSNSKNYQSYLIRNQQNIQDFSLSQISNISLLRTDKSTSTIINQKSFNFSTIGVEAVNFKNSLVQQRQSLKDSDKNFIKKQKRKPSNNQQQLPINSKSFLRTTLNSKIRPNRANEYISQKCHSKDSKTFLLGKTQNYLTQIKPLNKCQQFNFIRPASSNQRYQQKIKSQIDNDFNNVSLSIIQKQQIPPTRDESNNKPIQNGQKYIYKSQKIIPNQKERSYIKILSKK